MKVKFDIVRIGKFRKDAFVERFLKENVDLMKSKISSLLKDIKYKSEYNEMGLILVIPARGENIKIYIEDLQDTNVKKILSPNFPHSIYKRNYSIIEDNVHNPIFPIRVYINIT